MSEKVAKKPSEALDADFVPERMTHEQALEAMRANKFELVGVWYEEQMEISDRDPTGVARIGLTVEMAKMQSAAGLFEYAFVTLSDARQGAQGAGNRELVDSIDALGQEFSRSDPAHRPWNPES